MAMARQQTREKRSRMFIGSKPTCVRYLRRNSLAIAYGRGRRVKTFGSFVVYLSLFADRCLLIVPQ